MVSKKPTSPEAVAPIAASSMLDYPCVEKGVWTPIPKSLPKDKSLRLKLKDIDADESDAVKARGSMTFHAVGCAGCFEDAQPGLMVGQSMAGQVDNPTVTGGLSADRPSFFYHLGDIVYKADSPDPSQAPPADGKDQEKLYATQFYAQYESYKPNIFAIPGNHDSKSSKHDGRSAITHFIENFCDSKRRPSPDCKDAWRKTMTQPYPYWLLETPAAYIVGLAANDVNGGQLDDPMGDGEPQYEWLVATLNAIKAENQARQTAQKTFPKAVLLAVHYPPFSGGADFSQRGDPNLGPTPRPNPRTGTLLPLGMILHRAFHITQQYPDAVISAHAHLYQRITYTLGGGHQIPYIIAGCGGHGPIEKLTKDCWKKISPAPAVPFDTVLPNGLAIPNGDKIQVVYFNDQDFGFLRISVNPGAGRLTGEFFAVQSDSGKQKTSAPKLKDSFTLDLKSHLLSKPRTI